jgi:ABC-type enterochelin transport system ATPase subunit
MGEIDRELLFEHKFTNDMDFKSHFDKIKTFRVMDEEGNIINKDGHHKIISNEKLKKIYDTMVTINEADIVFN